MRPSIVVVCDCGREIELVAQPARLTEDEARLRDAAVRIVHAEPATYTRTDLVTRMGCRKRTGLGVVRRLIDEGVLAPRHRRARLSVAEWPAWLESTVPAVPTGAEESGP